MRIAVDAMGGDFAPREIVLGAIEGIKCLPEITKLYLVGAEKEINDLLKAQGFSSEKIEVVPASQVVGMGETPAAAVRRKRDSSITRAVELVKEGRADAIFSAGNTGAAVAATTLILRPLEGVIRPAIATVIPTPVKPFILIDSGANTDCTAEMMVQFAIMGSIYSQKIIGVANPTVGLVNIGGEDAKGNEITKEAFNLLSKTNVINFDRNVESHDLFEGRVDVVVCDGFVGNVILKTSESVAHSVSHWLKELFAKNPVRMLGAFLCRGAFKEVKRMTDPAVHGGAPLLGINGACIIGHGVSSSVAVCNALRVCCDWTRSGINQLIKDSISKTINK